MTKPSTPRILAHELGHIFGAVHDGVKNSCTPNQYLMSQQSSDKAKIWSECTKKEIQDEYDIREDRLKLGLNNCLFI